MARKVSGQAGILGALFTGVFLLTTGGAIFALMSLLSGVLPRFIEGLVLLFVIPAGVPVLFAKALDPLARCLLGDPGNGENPLLLLAGIWGATFFIPSLLYFVLLLQDVDLLRNGVIPLSSWKPGVAAWIQVDSAPAWEQRGEARWTTTQSKTNTKCSALALAVPASPGAGPERVWYCSVEHCVNGPLADHLRQVGTAIQRRPTGGMTLRDAATRSHCDKATERSRRGASPANERLYLTPGPAPEELARQTWRRLFLFFLVVALLWVILPTVVMGISSRRQRAQAAQRDAGSTPG